MTNFAERDPRKVAAAGLIAIVLLVVGVLNIDKLPVVGSGNDFQATFSDASGLQRGEAVTLAGIKVGEIDEIELDGAHVVVSFHVNGADLPDATRASIEIKTLLGQHHLALHPAGSGTLEDGARIPLSRTTTPLNIVPALQEATETIQEIDTAQLGSALDVLSDTLDQTAPEVRGTLRGLSSLSRTISARDAELKLLFKRARSVTGTLASRNEEVTELIGDSQLVLETLQQRKGTIRRLVSGTAELAEQLSGLVADNQKRFVPTLRKLNSVLAVLRKNDRNLDKSITQLTTYVRIFTNVVGSGKWFDSVVKIPRGLTACSNPAGNPLAELIDPILSAANERANGSNKPCLPLGDQQHPEEGGR